MRRTLFALLVAACQNNSPLSTGQWELSASVEIDGVDFRTPPAVYQRCVTAELARHPAELFRPQGVTDCELYDVKVQRNNLNWTVECKDGKGSARVTFHPDRYDGLMRLELRRQGVSRLVTTTLSGRRLGDCK